MSARGLSSMNKIMCVDPGIRVAFALIDLVKLTIDITDMPFEPGVGGKNSVSATGVARLLEASAPDYTYIESVFSSPQMGVTSAFSFGRSLGLLEGASASRSVLTKPRPQDWKGATNTPKDKDQARSRAMQLFPSAYSMFTRKKDDGRAEAALIAFYGALKLHMTPNKALELVDFPS